MILYPLLLCMKVDIFVTVIHYSIPIGYAGHALPYTTCKSPCGGLQLQQFLGEILKSRGLSTPTQQEREAVRYLKVTTRNMIIKLNGTSKGRVL